MKNQLLWLAAFALAMTSLLTIGCSDDETTTTGKTPPSILLESDVDIVSTSTTVAVGATFTVRVSASAGDDLITLFTIEEDFQNLPTDRITNLTDADIINNPLSILSGTYQTGFNWDIELTAADVAGTYTYSFSVEDENGLSDNVEIEITVANNPPVVDFADTHVYTDTAVAADAVFELNVVATKGDNVLETVSILEDGNLVDVSRLTIDGNAATDNPITLTGDDVDGFDWLIGITANSSGTATYAVEVEDFALEVGSNSVTVLVGDLVELTGVLLNQGGPPGTGGINLLTGEGTGSSDASAHIKDQGINTGPVPENWNQKISGINGSVIRTLSASTLENFSFDGVQTKEAVESLYSGGDSLIGDETEVVQIGDVFVVNNGTDYFLLLVTGINITTNDNGDFYEFSIKY